MAQHTPGPWRVERHDGFGRLCVVGEIGRIAILCEHDIDSAAWDQDTANAELIAYAPDLLRMLESLVFNFPLSGISLRDPRREAMERMLTAARDLIGNAKGERIG